jgi:quinol monooxygenase YgiN
MALAVLGEIPGLTQEQYEAVVRKVNQSGTPAGALFHAGGPIEGGYRIIEVWETQEAADAFYNSEILKEATATLTTQPKTTTWPVYGLDDGSGWRKLP